ncbi:hypothetical protein ACLKA7_004858 [Drosophila subpalustris]
MITSSHWLRHTTSSHWLLLSHPSYQHTGYDTQHLHTGYDTQHHLIITLADTQPSQQSTHRLRHITTSHRLRHTTSSHWHNIINTDGSKAQHI